jgi:CRISPR-associated endonuclease/helicase Cas3
VGLDYDIRTLVMEKPRTAESFVQRFGRAGRKSEAEVYLYRTDRLNWWCDEMEFPEFVERIYDSLDTQQTDSDRLLNLSGLRAAYAVRDRERGYSEIEEDFADVPNYGKWMSFLITTEDVLGDDDGAFFEGYPQDLVNLFEFVDECAEALHGLRGRSLNYRIEYPRGDSTAVTSYDLLSAFHYYRIDEVHEDKVKLRPKNPEDRTQIRVTFPGYENQYRNWTGSLAEIEEEMRNWLGAKISRADIAEETDVTEELVNYFLSLVGITRSALPSEIAYGSHEFEVRRTSIIPEVVPKDV